MRRYLLWGVLLAFTISRSVADVYFHFPHGSNNRLNGNQENVKNDKRLFDSQNNGKAGYNVGDSLDSNPGDNIQEVRQLHPEFYMSGCDAKAKSEVEIMWTNQHGTGPKTDDRVETQIILQYMCQEYPEGKMSSADVRKEFDFHTIRNGQSLSTQEFRAGQAEKAYIKLDRGLHEPASFYESYSRRERNKGLFTPNQDGQELKGTKAIYTRQNAAGTRRGLEVPEERDYYPYWGPSPWRDIAIMVSNKKTEGLMNTYVGSPEYYEKWMCIMTSTLEGEAACPRINSDNSVAKECVASHITADSCRAAGGKWTKFMTNYIERTAGVLSTCHTQGHMSLKRGLPYEPHKVSQGADGKEEYLLFDKPPEVLYAPSTVVNHNGMNMEGKFSSYKWKVPCFATNTTQRCVLRIRYNITTKDVPRDFDYRNNSSVKNNPKTKAVDDTTDLQLALNTAQLGRTFQDRTHVILLKPRNQLPRKYQQSNIYYIGGMGKRGNIVQTYPAMEYRFNPERLTVSTKDIVCFVWSVKNNPKTKAVDDTTDLQLALNTAQLGRTFQDRTHVILLKPRNQLPRKYQQSNIYYIGGMGKRGNIVQTYPAMEYRFNPERLTVSTKDIVCFVWSGSNNNPNNAGQGRARSDRTNVCWVKEGCSSLKPAACANIPLEVVDVDANSTEVNLHLNKGCYEGDKPLQAQLDNAPASCNLPCFRIKEPGDYCYMGTRNNNFSNRRHMGQITVKKAE